MADNARQQAMEVTGRLARRLAALPPPAPAALAYHPLLYAQDGWAQYLSAYGGGRKRLLLVGMNPGPFGMAQTGVPFGSVPAVRGWLQLCPQVRAPARMHPRRPIEGMACRRQEVSGARLWAWAAAAFGSPKAFFAHAMVYNFCPVMWLCAAGRNLPPSALPVAARRPVEQACQQALARLVDIWRPAWVVGIGAFAAAQAKLSLGEGGARIGQVLHPSPASPQANRGWAAQASAQMHQLAGSGWP